MVSSAEKGTKGRGLYCESVREKGSEEQLAGGAGGSRAAGGQVSGVNPSCCYCCRPQLAHNVQSCNATTTWWGWVALVESVCLPSCAVLHPASAPRHSDMLLQNELLRTKEAMQLELLESYEVGLQHMGAGEKSVCWRTIRQFGAGLTKSVRDARACNTAPAAP